MKFKIWVVLFISTSFAVMAQNYQPSPENLKHREWFESQRFGIMIHWGLYSLLAGDGGSLLATQ